MTVKSFGLVCKSVTGLLMTFILFSCGNMPVDGGSQRKKMLDLTSGSSTGDCGFASADRSSATLHYATTETSMLVNGVNSNMLCIAIPYAHYDSIALAQVQHAIPFALPLLTQWAQQKKGVLINLRNNAQQGSHRIDYVLEAPGAFAIPVVFLFDQWSAYRAGTAINLLYTLPGVQCKPLMGYEGMDKRLRQGGF